MLKRYSGIVVCLSVACLLSSCSSENTTKGSKTPKGTVNTKATPNAKLNKDVQPNSFSPPASKAESSSSEDKANGLNMSELNEAQGIKQKETIQSPEKNAVKVNSRARGKKSLGQSGVSGSIPLVPEGSKKGNELDAVERVVNDSFPSSAHDQFNELTEQNSEANDAFHEFINDKVSVGKWTYANKLVGNCHKNAKSLQQKHPAYPKLGSMVNELGDKVRELQEQKPQQ